MDYLERDEVSYDVRDSIAYLEILRVSSSADSNKSMIYSARGPDFVSALTKLIGYHENCLMAHESGETKVYTGAGSDRGEWHDMELRQWELKDASRIPHSEKTLLEKVVSMHNQVTLRCTSLVS